MLLYLAESLRFKIFLVGNLFKIVMHEHIQGVKILSVMKLLCFLDRKFFYL